MDIETTIRALTGRGFAVQHFATAAEAADYLDGAIDGTTVGIGGSKTIDQLGLYDRLAEHNTVWWHWRTPGFATLDNALTAPVYLSSANAISEDGEILNIDGTGNRTASLMFGHKKVYIVAGTNKICPDFESALYRARNVAAVQNCRRFPDKNTPCKIDGKCHDCRSRDRICNALEVLWGPMNRMETEIVLIDGDYGM
mgnify:FL=1